MSQTFVVPSPIGYWSVTTTESLIESVDFAGDSPATMRAAETKLELRVQCMLARYFKGEVIDFSGLPLRFPETPKPGNLTARVMQRLLQMRYSEVQSYQWLAEQLGMPRAARAMGGALGRNPIPIIVPCHRIIAKHGGLGGFMQGDAGGSRIKTFLLELEGHRFDGNRLRNAALGSP